MNNVEKAGRNENIDVLRGIAMLLVILGHTLTGTTEGSQDSFLFQIIWSLQMPLFILISGYVTKYSKPIGDLSALARILWKRTVAYLLPWSVWSFLVRGLILQQKSYLDIGWLIRHMDSGYWFLFTLWTIVVIFTFSKFIAYKVSKGKSILETVTGAVIYITGMGLLAGLGKLLGMEFLAVKLTLYYMPFYYAGHLYGKYQARITALKKAETLIDAVSAACFVVWFVIITRVNLYYADDGGISLLLRATASLTGCVAVCAFVTKYRNDPHKKERKHDFLKWCGNHSLEIYLLHGLVLNLLKIGYVPAFGSAQGMLLAFANYALSLLLIVLIIGLLNTNRMIKTIAFGKSGG